MNIKNIALNILSRTRKDDQFADYIKRFNEYSFVDSECSSKEQFEASIIRLYHTIEKGLSYLDYRPGFGINNVEKLICGLETYGKKYGTDTFVYRTALSSLNAYVKKNRENGYVNDDIETKINSLPGVENGLGGAIEINKPNDTFKMNFEELLSSRHSIRHFSSTPVDIRLLEKAIELAQHTPSACNRQGWATRIVKDRNALATVLSNQNGNKGFGNEFDKVLIITADLRAQQRGREKFQAFIDGGMYAENLLNALYYYGIGAVPLSASLTSEQEKNIRKRIGIDSAEVFILIIGVGNYPDGKFLTTRSERKPAVIKVI